MPEIKRRMCKYPRCGKMFERTANNQRYCGPECALRARNDSDLRCDRRHSLVYEALCTNPDCRKPFERKRSDTAYCPDCAREIMLEKARRRTAMRTIPSEHVEGILALQKAKRELAEQIRAQRFAMYEAYEAKKSEGNKAS